MIFILCMIVWLLIGFITSVILTYEEGFLKVSDIPLMIFAVFLGPIIFAIWFCEYCSRHSNKKLWSGKNDPDKLKK